MTYLHRRSVLSALGLMLPIGLPRPDAAAAAPVSPPALQFRSFEESLRRADAGSPGATSRVEVGHSELLQAGVQGCSNDRPFAGFAAGRLHLTRVAHEPGPVYRGVRLYVCTVDVTLDGGRDSGAPGRPLNFALIPPAPVFRDATSRGAPLVS